MFWHASVHPSICLSTRGVPISHNALQHFPECHQAAGGGYPDPPPGGYPGQVPPRGVGTWVRYPPGGVPDPRGVPGSGTPRGGTQTPPGGVPDPGGGTQVRYPRGGCPGQVPPRGGYPGRTTEGVLTTRRAVCLLRSRRRTFLFFYEIRLLCSGFQNTVVIYFCWFEFILIPAVWTAAFVEEIFSFDLKRIV